MAISEYNHHECTVNIRVLALPSLQTRYGLTNGVQERGGTIRNICPTIEQLHIDRRYHRPYQIYTMVKKGQSNPDLLLRKFSLHTSDPANLLIETIDGGIDAVAHGSAAIHDQMIIGAWSVHGC